jgi:hypothetical protein
MLKFFMFLNFSDCLTTSKCSSSSIQHRSIDSCSTSIHSSFDNTDLIYSDVQKCLPDILLDITGRREENKIKKRLNKRCAISFDDCDEIKDEEKIKDYSNNYLNNCNESGRLEF